MNSPLRSEPPSTPVHLRRRRYPSGGVPFLLLVICYTPLRAAGPAVTTEGAYPVQWGHQFGTPGDDVGGALYVFPSGTSYIAGSTNNSFGAPFLGGHGDIFLTSHDVDGDLVWVRQFGTSGADVSHGMSVDKAGNILIAGYTEGSLGGVAAGHRDGLVAKLDSAGNLLWARQHGSLGHDENYDVVTDKAGNSFVTGYTNGDFGGTNAGFSDAFLAKYDPDGELQWTRQLGTFLWDEGWALAVDEVGNVLVTGDTQGSLFGPQVGHTDIFLAKYDTDGTLIWAQQTGARNSTRARALVLDADGNSYITGTTTGGFGGVEFGQEDVYLAKFDAFGEHLWTKQFGTPHIDAGHSLALDANGDIFLSGTTTGDLAGLGAGQSDAFLVKLTSTGELAWGLQFGTVLGDSANDVRLDAQGNVYLSGVASRALFGEWHGTVDTFLMKLAGPDTQSIPEPTTYLSIIPAALGLWFFTRRRGF